MECTDYYTISSEKKGRQPAKTGNCSRSFSARKQLGAFQHPALRTTNTGHPLGFSEQSWAYKVSSHPVPAVGFFLVTRFGIGRFGIASRRKGQILADSEGQKTTHWWRGQAAAKARREDKL